VKTWRWSGSGHAGPDQACEWAFVESGDLAMEGGPVHNAWLYLAHRFGLVGVLAVVGLAVLIGYHMRLGTLLGATLAAGCVVLSVTSPYDALLRWLRNNRPGPLFG